MHLSIADIARLVNGELVGDGRAEITGCAGIVEAKQGELAFLANPKYLTAAQSTKASAVLVPRQIDLPGKVFIRTDSPSLAFTQVLQHFAKQGPQTHPNGVHASAVVSAQAKIGKSVALGPHTVVEAGAEIGEGSIIYAQCYVGQGVKVGRDCLIYPGVVLREGVVLGDRVAVHSGSVIGADGYGYVTVEGRHVKIPQTGTVVIENDVEIGANVTIDRARFDKTLIGEGTKIDNLVQIAHNVVIGKHCLIIAQSGVSGSSRLGNYVILAGQAGVVGHLTIGDGAIVAAQSGVSKDIPPGRQVFGSPAQPAKDAYKAHAHVQRLDHYVSMIKDLKKRIEELEKRK